MARKKPTEPPAAPEPPKLPPFPYAVIGPEAGTRGFGTGAGRPKGQKDKITYALKEAILLAAAEVGDSLAASEPGRTGGLAGYLSMVASTDVKAFCALLGKVLPMTIAGDSAGGGIVVEIVKRTYAPETQGEAT